jgi:pSer/pThr/pTyr-binding forkhead associated (FHA) protein
VGSVGRSWWVEWTDAHGTRRIPLVDRLTVGRSRQSDVVLDDMYVSREHCVIELDGEDVRVDASRSVNKILVGGELLDGASFSAAGTFSVGETTIALLTVANDDEATRVLERPSAGLRYRRSTRELLGAEGTVVAQFSAQEGAAFGAIVAAYPDAAATARISTAVWGEPDYESYLIHRLVQRIRRRMGDLADLVENVRGAGYRLRSPIDLR